MSSNSGDNSSDDGSDDLSNYEEVDSNKELAEQANQAFCALFKMAPM